MTNNEALRTLKANYPDACFEQLREAVDVAINALTKEAWKEEHPVSPLLQKLATNLQPSKQDDVISRQQAIDALDCINGVEEVLRALPSAQPETHEERTETHACDLISRQKVMYKLTALVNEIEEIFASIREREVDDSVCGLCEYDGAYIGQSGDWCNECPGFEKDNCFKLKDKYRTEWESIDG